MRSRALYRCLVLLGAPMLATSSLGDEELDANRGKWKTTGIDHYELRYQRVCECHREVPADTIVTVDGGRIVDVRYRRDDYLTDIPVPAERRKWFSTVEDFFGLIERALQSGALVRASYQPDLGYPRRIYIDYHKLMVGEEVELHILEVRDLD